MRFGNLNLRSVDLNLLVALQALLEERGVTRAADRLNVSQPAMSRMLGRLREILEDPLLVRSGREMIPTQRAAELVGPLEVWLSDAVGLLTPSNFDPASAAGVLRIMTTDAATEAVVTPWICDLARHAPGLRFELSALASPVSAALARGDADYAVDTFPDPGPDCHVQQLIEDRFVCVVRTGHPTIRGPLSAADYQNALHIQVTGSGGGNEFLEQDLARFGVRRRIIVKTPSIVAAPYIVARSDWVLTIPNVRARRAARRYPIEVYSLPFPVRDSPLSLLWHNRVDRSGLHRWARGRLAKLDPPPGSDPIL